MSDPKKPWPPVVAQEVSKAVFPESEWHPIYEGPTIPLQVSRVVFREDGTAVIEGVFRPEHEVNFIATNLTLRPDGDSIVVEDVPTEFERVLPEEKP